LARRTIDLVDVLSSIPDQESSWIVPAIARGITLGLRWRPHVLYSTAPPWSAQLVGLGITRVLRCPWVADFRDPWSRAPWRDGQAIMAQAASMRLERRVISAADAIVFNTRTAQADFASFYGQPHALKFHIIPNGCDVGEMHVLPASAREPFVLLHAGSLYGARSPLTLVQAIAAARDRGLLAPGRFKLTLLGATPDAAASALVAALNVAEMVEFAPRVSRREGLAQMASATALLLLQQGHALSVPAKTYEYLATGRPILALTDHGETARVISESGVGVVSPGNDPEAIMGALLRIVEMARRGVTPAPRSMFDGQQRATELVDLIAAVARRSADATTAARLSNCKEGGHAT
jgi:glycosyltransferase involved in cell wall biosynthesis